MAEADRIDLAHEPDFVLARLIVSPSHRALLRDDGAREVIEHRVMQVLIVLAKAKGAVVTRDELTEACWDGRVVGEDAINRVISRLRKSAGGIGAGSFRIETVTKIGYRLWVHGAAETEARAPVTWPPEGAAPKLSRRALTTGLLAAGAVGLTGGGALLYRKVSRPSLSPEAASLMDRGSNALAQGTLEGQNQAMGLFRRATEIAPDYADSWGMLGTVYAMTALYRRQSESRSIRARARSSGQRALELDSGNAYGLLAISLAQPMRGHWLDMERGVRRALDRRSDDALIREMLARFLCQVGRFNEALQLFEHAHIDPPSAEQYFSLIQTLWGAGRSEELDRAMNEAAALYPTQFSIWFSRFFIYLHGGDPGAAIAVAANVEKRPSGIPPQDFDDVLAVARAAQSGNPKEIDAVMAAQMAHAHLGTGKAENAMQFACLFGRLDDAFAIADAYYFGRGFIVPDLRFSEAQATYLTPENRLTRFLFQPSTRAMRADPRFRRLTGELGLEHYWTVSGVQPDYRRT